MNEFGAAKTKGIKLNWWQILVTVVASVLLLSVLVFFIDDLVNRESEVRYHQTGFARAELAFYNSWARHGGSDIIGSFKDVDTAVRLILDSSDKQKIGEITRFEDAGKHIVFFSNYTRLPIFRPMIPLIYIVLFTEQGDSEVIIAHTWFQEVEAIMYERRRKLFDEDRVARDIVLAYIHRDITAVANGDVPIYYGVGLGNPPAHLSILGYEPDNIIAFEYIGEYYYFWYYLSAPQFGEVLSDNIDISTSFMLAEVIELFDIQIIR